MTRIRRIILSAIVAIAMIVSAVPAFASELYYTQDPNIVVINNSSYISAQELNEIVNDVSATIMYDNGTVVPIKSIITINDITPLNPLKGVNSARKYRIASRSKVEADADSKSDEGVAASIYLELTWEDVAGPENIFESLEGSIDITEGKLKSSSTTYGALGFAGTFKTLNLGTKTSFSKTVNMTAPTPTASYVARFEGANFQLNVSVTPSVFD